MTKPFFACITMQYDKNSYSGLGRYLHISFEEAQNKIYSKRPFSNFCIFPGFWRDFFILHEIFFHNVQKCSEMPAREGRYNTLITVCGNHLAQDEYAVTKNYQTLPQKLSTWDSFTSPYYNYCSLIKIGQNTNKWYHGLKKPQFITWSIYTELKTKYLKSQYE